MNQKRNVWDICSFSFDSCLGFAVFPPKADDTSVWENEAPLEEAHAGLRIFRGFTKLTKGRVSFHMEGKRPSVLSIYKYIVTWACMMTVLQGEDKKVEAFRSIYRQEHFPSPEIVHVAKTML